MPVPVSVAVEVEVAVAMIVAMRTVTQTLNQSGLKSRLNPLDPQLGCRAT